MGDERPPRVIVEGLCIDSLPRHLEEDAVWTTRGARYIEFCLGRWGVEVTWR